MQQVIKTVCLLSHSLGNQHQHIIFFFFRDNDVAFTIVIEVSDRYAVRRAADANWRVRCERNSVSSAKANRQRAVFVIRHDDVSDSVSVQVTHGKRSRIMAGWKW